MIVDIVDNSVHKWKIQEKQGVLNVDNFCG